MDASYEKIGSFYLGKKYDLASRELLDDLVCYDAKDLTTHAMCVGMTGSGKTGLCLALLEEAAIDGIPAIAIDPKGDLGNLLLAFPELKPTDFQPWVDEGDAKRQGLSIEELAQKTADSWRSGLAKWHQDPERIAKFRDSVDITIYTPGSNAGVPLTVLRSFDAPPREVVEDADLFRERVAGAASGLLTLLGIDCDPLTSRPHILLSNIFSDAWSKGQDLELASLIRLIQNPPISKIGVFDIDSFLPPAERMKLAMSLNNLLASPAFAGWLEGEPLDIKSLLHTPTGKPRLSIISIAHLSDSERMFFVTILLNELLSWMRTQPGTSSLRALFYMDEVYGYFPPSAKPPSKPPMLVLLKQARAFGLGIALATQNPVDLDYKGLANIGTWFLGRLQTERDKARVLEGLEGAALQSGAKFNRSQMEQTLAALGSRVFLMNNVHDDGPTIFQTRWVLSYLRGPLNRQDIQKLVSNRKSSAASDGATSATRPAGADRPSPQVEIAQATNTAKPGQRGGVRPVLAADIPERFVVPTLGVPGQAEVFYRAALLGTASAHYVKAAANVDTWVDTTWLCHDVAAECPWDNAARLPARSLELSKEPIAGFVFEELPDELRVGKNYKKWPTSLKDFLYRHEPMRVFECAELKLVSQPGQDELDARLSMEQRLREVRDAEKEKLQDSYAKRLRDFETKIQAAKQRADRESAQFYERALDIGQTVLGILVGNKRSRASRTTSAVRDLGRAAQKHTQSASAKEILAGLLEERQQLIDECETKIQELRDRNSIHTLNLTPIDIPCRKSDTRVDLVSLVWVPWMIGSDGRAAPLVSTD